MGPDVFPEVLLPPLPFTPPGHEGDARFGFCPTDNPWWQGRSGRAVGCRAGPPPLCFHEGLLLFIKGRDRLPP